MSRLAIIESAYRSRARDVNEARMQEAYAAASMRNSLSRGEYPLAGHLLYTRPGVLDDTDDMEHELRVNAALGWSDVADVLVVYVDLGVTEAMELVIAEAQYAQRPVEYRSLPQWTELVADGRAHLIGKAYDPSTRKGR